MPVIMNYIFPVLLFISLVALLWLGWRYRSLRRELNQYTHVLREAAKGKLTPQALPADVQGLEGLSNAVKSLQSTFNFKLATSDADRARLAAVLDQMTDGVIIANPEGVVQFANPAAEKLFGKELLDRSITEVLRHHQLIHAWQTSQNNDEMKVETVELPNRRQFLQLIVIPDRYTPGGSLLLVQDLTRVRQLETVRRDFISNISHELRTPLASLKALTETLQGGALSDSEAAPRFLGLMVTEVDALTQMAQELLDLSRIESGRLDLSFKPIAPKKLLASASERMRLQIERAGLSLDIDCPPNLPKVEADEQRVEQVLVNLIHNAVKFTRPGGNVILLAETVEDFVRFAIKDTGVGIPADDVPRIFERFYRVDKSRAGGGTGLGLSISRHLIESHGGRIWAESVEGQGSTFFFTLKNVK